MVTYRGIQYPTRELSVRFYDGGEADITIAGIELQKALFTENDEPRDAEADDIDCTIYYYVDDMTATAEEICADGLDEPMTLIEEY